MTPPTPAERAQWQAACEAATPGPWQTEQGLTDQDFTHWNVRTAVPQPDAPWAPRLIAWLSGMIRQGGGEPGVIVCPECHHARLRHRQPLIPYDVRWDDQTEADAQFIATAREALPRLLAALTATEAERDKALADATKWHMEYQMMERTAAVIETRERAARYDQALAEDERDAARDEAAGWRGRAVRAEADRDLLGDKLALYGRQDWDGIKRLIDKYGWEWANAVADAVEAEDAALIATPLPKEDAP